MESSIWCASGAELTILSSIIAVYIGEIYDATDLNTISNFFEALGDNLAILAAQKNRCNSSKEKYSKENSNTINNLFPQ